MRTNCLHCLAARQNARHHIQIPHDALGIAVPEKNLAVRSLDMHDLVAPDVSPRAADAANAVAANQSSRARSNSSRSTASESSAGGIRASESQPRAAGTGTGIRSTPLRPAPEPPGPRGSLAHHHRVRVRAATMRSPGQSAPAGSVRIHRGRECVSSANTSLMKCIAHNSAVSYSS